MVVPRRRYNVYPRIGQVTIEQVNRVLLESVYLLLEVRRGPVKVREGEVIDRDEYRGRGREAHEALGRVQHRLDHGGRRVGGDGTRGNDDGHVLRPVLRSRSIPRPRGGGEVAERRGMAAAPRLPQPADVAPCLLPGDRGVRGVLDWNSAFRHVVQLRTPPGYGPGWTATPFSGPCPPPPPLEGLALADWPIETDRLEARASRGPAPARAQSPRGCQFRVTTLSSQLVTLADLSVLADTLGQGEGLSPVRALQFEKGVLLTARSRLEREGNTKSETRLQRPRHSAKLNTRTHDLACSCVDFSGSSRIRACDWRDSAASMEPSRCSQGGEGRKRKLEAPNSEGSLVASDTADLKALLDQHSDQMRRMQSQIDGLVAINSTLQARLDGHAERQAQEVDELREKCNVLQLRCGSLERSIQVLRKDVSWSYSAPSIPRSHWIEQGRDDEYAAHMEGSLRGINQDVECIRNGEDEDFYCRCLDYCGQMEVLHDDALLPHFKELADAIQLSSGIREIIIDSIELRPSALRILFPAMEGKVKVVDMRRIRIPGPDAVKCYEIIAASIRRNHSLKGLTWCNNRISSDDQADLLIKSIIDNRSIENVQLANCFNQSGVDGCRALVALMTCGRPFNWLDFSGNCLSDIDDVAAALATNPQLQQLLIHDNEINDRDAELIAQALKQNTNLQ
ncbi:hypothetical protein THAOC_32202, partial [Thalassiosira oceanica]